MKKLAFLMVFAMAFVLMGGLALADTPHGPFADNTQLCAACHRAHTAQAEYLIADVNTIGICVACHDGSGADCNVKTGTYVVNGSWTSSATADRPAATLLNGATIVGATTITVDSTVGYIAGESIAIGAADAQTNVTVPGSWEIVTVTTVDSATQFTVPALTTAHADNSIVGNVTASAADHDTWGTAGSPLMGGGFEAVVGTGATSAHIPDVDVATNNVYWGVQFGEGTAPGTAITALTCVSCHIPHRSANYRMLRQTPQGMNDETAALVVGDNFARDAQGNITTASHYYTEDDGKFNLARTTDTVIRGGVPVANAGISAWCGACHDYYYDNASKDSGNTAPADGAGRTVAAGYYDINGADAGNGQAYMHSVDVDTVYLPRNSSTAGSDLNLYVNLGLNTFADKLPLATTSTNLAGDYQSADQMNCLTCHRAHGTDAAMAGQAAIGVKTRLALGAAGNDASEDMTDSVLLRLPNRGVCETCHQMPTGY